ncbi:MAG TPA: XRE family transcriptional regulator [Rhabdochlamydiaceae bacterium]|nr:XRE family transcriptional regulator [Rhabdochlamydiaceae bacterium]
MNEKELGKRIQLAREKRGLTQEKVEQRIGLPQKAMTRIETGQRIPSTLELAKLAELFHMPIGDFLKDEAVDEDPLTALHRVAPGLEQDPKIREEVDRCVHLCKEGICLERLLDQPPRRPVLFYPNEKPDTISTVIKQGEMAAKEERRRLGIGNIPIRDIIELLSSQGIWCAATPLPPEMSGLFLYRPSIGMIILINATHGRSRQRFSCAHEYAHALFDADHHILISDSTNFSELLEKRANAFAAAFLMPEEGIAEIMQSFNKGHASRTSFAIYDASTQGAIETEERQFARNQKLSPQDVAFIAYRFGVSYQAAVYRLHSLRYLSQKEREKLLEEESKGRDYLRLLDLEDLEQIENSPLMQRELRTYVSRLVIEAYRQEKISRGRVIELSKLLNLPAQDLLELADIENE